jgi:glutathione S-transferase
LWVQGHLEPWVQRDALAGLREACHHAQTAIDAALRRRDGALAGRHWLVNDHFDVADLNVAAVLSPSRVQSIDLRPYKHVGPWLARCHERPAAVATRRRFEGFIA